MIVERLDEDRERQIAFELERAASERNEATPFALGHQPGHQVCLADSRFTDDLDHGALTVCLHTVQKSPASDSFNLASDHGFQYSTRIRAAGRRRGSRG
jgi:hypothetical protein